MKADVASRHPFWAHLRQAILGEGLGLGLSLLVLPVASRRLGAVGFSEYVVAARVLAFLQPVLLLGVGVGLTRAIAGAAKGTERDVASLTAAAMLCVTTSLVVVAVVILAFPDFFTRVVFDETGARGLLLGLVATLYGSCVFNVATSGLRGTFSMRAANTLYPIYLGVVPLVALALARSATAALLLIGAGWTAVSLSFLVPLLRTRPQAVRAQARRLLAFGLPRVPGEFALFGLLSIPALLAVRSGGVVAGGHVALAMSLVTLGGAACAPLASTLLPHASRAMSDSDEMKELAKLVRSLIRLIAAALVSSSIVVAIVAPTALRIGLGPEYERAATALRLACVAVPAYGVYVSLRSVVDAAFHRPLTMRYAVYGLVAFLGSFVATRPLGGDVAVMLSFDVGVWVLMTLVAWRTYHLLRTNPLPA